MKREVWVERVANLRVWKQHGERAPHKPLLLLYALARLQQTGSSSMKYAEVEGALDDLLTEFGPPRKTSPSYPFHHLVSDGLWTVATKDGHGSPGDSRKILRASGAVGSLSTEFAKVVEKDTVLFVSVVQAVLDSNFPVSLHESILSALGLDVDVSEALHAATKKASHHRDPAFREKVLTAYEYQCAVCGYDGRVKQQVVGLEAAHVRWWQAHGPTEVDNALALCSLHHQLLDRGAIGLTESHSLQVSSYFIGNSNAVTAMVALAGHPLLHPQSGQPLPHPKYIAWHASQVFRSPARATTAA